VTRYNRYPPTSSEVADCCDVTSPESLDEIQREQKVLEEYNAAASRGWTNVVLEARCGQGSTSRGNVIIPIMGDCSDDIQAIWDGSPRRGRADTRGSHVPGGAIVVTPKQEMSRLYSRTMRALSSVSCDDVSTAFGRIAGGYGRISRTKRTRSISQSR
jgi:hypothetical protein